MRQSNASINRFAMLLQDDMFKLQQLTNAAAFSKHAAGAVRNLLSLEDLTDEIALEEAVKAFTLANWNNTAVKDEYGNITGYKYGVSKETTYWALLDLEFNTMYSAYYPKTGASIVGTVKFPPPTFYPRLYKAVTTEAGRNHTILKLLTPNEGDLKPMLVSFEEVIDPSDKNQEVLGFLVAGRALLPRMKQYSDDTPTCIVIQDGPDGKTDWDKVDLEMFDKVVPGSFGPNKTYGGEAVFLKRDNETVQNMEGRLCPDVPLFNATSSLMVGYFKLCGLDPKNYKEDAGCVMMRVDRPMSMVDQGTVPVITLSLVIIILMIILCVIFVFFLDYAVLRRIVNLSNVIRTQTKGHSDAMKEEDETTLTMSMQDDSIATKKHGRSGKSASGSSENSRTADSDASGEAGPTAPQRNKSARDEIENLKLIMEQNATGLRKRLEVVNENIKVEQQKTMHQKQALQLMNLWCVRKDYFPGLRHNAMELRYEPPRSLDDLLANPLAVEFLKSHCESDRSLENLWFILDVAWLHELETAEAAEEDGTKRGQIHDVATFAAKTILHRYIDANAPQQINISAETFKKLRDKGEHYSPKMFDDAVKEVKLMLDTDILPRFQKTAAYSAMSETLFRDSSGTGEESEFSDETVSTAGSVLTDEGEDGEGGVPRVFAHAFRNLNANFEVAHDEASSTFSASSHATSGGALASASVIAGTVTTTSDEKNPKKEEPKKEEPKKEEPKKESEESSESSESSSSNSIGSEDSE